MAYTYFLRCSDDSLYCGWTTDIEQRLKAHNSGRGSKYTRSKLPVKLVWYYYTDNKILAQRLEFALKKLNKAKKEMLVINPELINEFCSDILEEYRND